MARRPLSVCIITLNEEENLPACLESVSWADEVVVVDSHSTDGTRELAEKAGARVIEHDFEGHIQQKNHAVEQATHDWVLCLDADERTTPELAKSIQAALESGDGDGGPAAYSFPRRTWHLGRWIRHGGWYPDRKIRLFDRRRGEWGGRNPHDHVKVQGDVERLSGDLLHYSYRDLSAHLKQIDFFTTIAARDKHERGERFRLHRLVLRPVGKFLRMYLLKSGWMDGAAGFILAVTGAYYVFLKYAKLRELEQAGDG
ncbi:MAG: glycosyltransferase family 2 protein [Planctomycetota bacterium]|jgi:glycosyltransferase involved in cell wall biosynthesis